MPHAPIDFTEIRVKLVSDERSRLKAYCCVTLADQFVVRDLKVVDGARGLFVAMPSRKVSDHCPRCRHKNHLRARFCNHCGGALDADRVAHVLPGADGRVRLHADLAHPINRPCRVRLHDAVLAAYALEVEKSQQDGYKPTSFDDFDLLDDDPLDEEYVREIPRPASGGAPPSRPSERGSHEPESASS
ncbi:MAG: septation protein SpoVG family protein [Planctomycetes bacterium]|nr:septation protein SpoVG family protein [Planctomycetota bacterium]